MNKLKICVYAISKNEEKFVTRFLDSCKEADLVIIGDTGSTDKTAELARAGGAVVYDIFVSPWRFDIPRNAVLSLIPKDVDVCISIDLDEVLQPGWRQEIERVWKDGVNRLRYKYDWGSGVQFYYEKIHGRIGYRWHHPVHEYPSCDGRIKEVYGHTDMLLVTHHPDHTKSRGQYLDLLELSVKEDPSCPRNAFYYARELTFYSQWDKAIDALNKYLSMPSASWDHERCFAMRLLGRSYENKNDHPQALKWYMRACAETPNAREPWLDIAQYYYNRNNWMDCYITSIKCISVTNKDLVYTANPECWGSKPYDLAAISSYYIGKIEESKIYGYKALELSPDDERLKNNLKFYTIDSKITGLK